METSEFRHDIERAFANLQARIHDFNAWWPEHVRSGEIWPLRVQAKGCPLLTDGGITVANTPDEDRISKAQEAIAQLMLVSTPAQDPKTAWRVPGWFALDAKPTAEVEAINAARDALYARVEQEIEYKQNQKKSGLKYTVNTRVSLRGVLLREIIPGLSLKHTFRKIQAFDASPLFLSFLWAGNATSHTLTSVAKERERMEPLIQVEAATREIAPDDTLLAAVKRELDPYRDDAQLLIVRKISPHPRVMLHFESRSRYDAMPHANLPLFFHCPEGQELPEVRALPSYRDKERDTAKRERATTRMRLINEADPERKVYVYQPHRKGKATARMSVDVKSTYKTLRTSTDRT